MNLSEILVSGSDPADFWSCLVQTVADQWQLTECVALQVDGENLKLFGSSKNW
jgi:hypothetical protein